MRESAKLFTATPNLCTGFLSRRLRLCGVDRQTMSESTGQLDDARHERHIAETSAKCVSAMRRGDKRLARALWLSLQQLVSTRSPDQVARMESKRGLRDA